jgi:lipid-A-disaccharide synthase
VTHIFISTGEVSGDLQGSLLIQALQRYADSRGLSLKISALGGDRMALAGAKLLANTSAISSVGILESLPFVGATLNIQRRVKRYLQQDPPDLVVMIDYVGPNLGIGPFVRKTLPQVPTVYYIAPQEWVWSLNQRNTELILQITDRLLAIFPAEATYYKQRGGDVIWVGHPLVDRLQTFPSRETARHNLGIPAEQEAIALLPVSRRQELKYVLPTLFEAAQQIQAQRPQAHFWIPLSLEIYQSALEQAIQRYGLRATLVSQATETVLAAADLALTKSGTVNLELALLDVPQVVMYRLNPVTAWVAQYLLKLSIPFASPVNLTLMEAIVPEYLQAQATPDRITQSALELLQPERQQTLRADYQRMQQALGEPGVCDRAARAIFELLPER